MRNISDNEMMCECCQGVSNKKPLDLLCSEEDLVFLGSGNSLFFKVSKYVGLILLIVFLVTGSGYYLIAGNVCEKEGNDCGSFFGFPIIIHEINPQDILSLIHI